VLVLTPLPCPPSQAATTKKSYLDFFGADSSNPLFQDPHYCLEVRAVLCMTRHGWPCISYMPCVLCCVRYFISADLPLHPPLPSSPFPQYGKEGVVQPNVLKVFALMDSENAANAAKQEAQVRALQGALCALLVLRVHVYISPIRLTSH